MTSIFIPMQEECSTRTAILGMVPLLWVACGAVHGCAAGHAKSPAGPNFVFILSDDQGWNGTSASMDPACPDAKSDYYLTPNIERLAREGMRFSQAYAPAAICSPTRRSLQFGQSPVRIGDQRFARSYPVGTERLTIPRLLKSANPRYMAAHFGKWDLRTNLLPKHLGYDQSDGNTRNQTGNEVSGFSKQEKWIRHMTTDDPKKIFSLTRRAIHFMERRVQEQRPFYLQISHYAIHADQQTRAQSLAKYQARKRGEVHHIPAYGGMTEDLDTGVGLVLDAIDKLNIASRTYVIYTSDNGGVPWIPPNKAKHLANPLTIGDKSRNFPLRSGKWTLYEGGLRVPLIVRGPGVQAGSFCAVPVVGWDLLPTIADLAGYQKPLPADLDGGSIKTLLTHAGKGAVLRANPDLVFHRYSHRYPHTAIRRGDFKLVKFWRRSGRQDEVQLFNLHDDLGETKNLAKELPAKTAELHQHMMDYLAAIDAEILSQ